MPDPTVVTDEQAEEWLRKADFIRRHVDSSAAEALQAERVLALLDDRRARTEALERLRAELRQRDEHESAEVQRYRMLAGDAQERIAPLTESVKRHREALELAVEAIERYRHVSQTGDDRYYCDCAGCVAGRDALAAAARLGIGGTDE